MQVMLGKSYILSACQTCSGCRGDAAGKSSTGWTRQAAVRASEWGRPWPSRHFRASWSDDVHGQQEGGEDRMQASLFPLHSHPMEWKFCSSRLLPLQLRRQRGPPVSVLGLGCEA